MRRTFNLKINVITTFFMALLLFTGPAAAITDMNGTPVQLQSVVGKGKWTVAKVWASDCPACRKTIHYLTQFEQRFPEAEVLGISVDGQQGKQNAQQFINQLSLNFPNLLAEVMEVDDYLYKTVGETLVGTPTIIVYNPQGKIAAVQPGAVTPDELIGFIRQKQTETTAAY